MLKNAFLLASALLHLGVISAKCRRKIYGCMHDGFPTLKRAQVRKWLPATPLLDKLQPCNQQSHIFSRSNNVSHASKPGECSGISRRDKNASDKDAIA